MLETLYALATVTGLASIFAIGHALFGWWFDAPMGGDVGRRRK